MASLLRHPLRLRLAVTIALMLSLLAVLAVIGPPGVDAQEEEPGICLYDSEGNGRSGAVVKYWTSGSWGGTIGTTGDDGCVAVDTSKNTNTRLLITYQRGKVETGVVDFSQGYTFNLVKVTIISPNLVTYQGYYQGFTSFSGPLELLPGTYTFADYYLKNRVTVTVGNENLTAAVVRLVDHEGNGLAGGTALYSFSTGWPAAPGETNSSGYLVIPLTGDPAKLTVQMYYKGTNQVKGPSQLQASNYTFQTTLTTVKLLNADGNPLDTGNVSYYAGGWRTFGAGTTTLGETSQEMLPGTWSFQMRYRGGLQGVSHTVSGTTSELVFQTGRITLHYSGSINFWGNNSWYVFQKPTEELLPGTWKFYLDGQSAVRSVDIDIAAGDKLVKSIVLARLTNSSNQPVAGGEASAYVGSWKTMGTTNASGWVASAFDGKLGNTSVKMSLNGTSQQLTQNHATNSVYLFKTAGITIELINSEGERIDTGDASYYAGSWRNLGPTQNGVVMVEMLPGKYSFAMVYNGTREQLSNLQVEAGSVVSFQTSLVTVSLADSNGDPLSNGSASYYAGSWREIGTTDANGEVSVEMLPGSYSFAMVYNGTREQKNSQPINDDGVASAVGFQTIGVTVELIDSNGNPLEGAATYYAGSWRNIDPSGEVEMLTGKYSFAMVYLGTREQKSNVDIGASPVVIFQTGPVHSGSGNATGFYAGSWRTFENDMELLSGSYTFRFSDRANKSFTLTGNAATTNIE